MLVTKKIKSFTIAELIIVIILSGIVISMAILVLNLVQRQVSGIQFNLQKQNQIQTLDKLLWHDFNKYELFFFPRKEILLCTNPTDTISYQFNKDYILRNQDTIKTDISKKIFYLNAKKVKENYVDAIEVTLTEEFQSKSLFVFKTKDATFYMNKY